MPTRSTEIYLAACSEVQAALTLTRRASQFQVDLAFVLRVRLPQVWQALCEGRIDLPRARVIADQTIHLPSETAQQAADTVVERASVQTTGQLRACLAKLVISIDPAAAKDRYDQGVKERRVITEATESGTANLLGLDLPTADTNIAMRRINRLARAARTRGDARTMDQLGVTSSSISSPDETTPPAPTTGGWST